jgi:hypothetical protein
MDASSMLFLLLDQPPSETGWGAFVKAVEKLPDRDLEGMLPELLTRLASWPDHLRLAKPDWVAYCQAARLRLCRVIPILPRYQLSTVLSSEFDRMMDATFDQQVMDWYLAHLNSDIRKVRNIFWDADLGVLLAFQSDYQSDAEEGQIGWDFLFLIDFGAQTTSLVKSIQRPSYWAETECELLERLAGDLIVLTVQYPQVDRTGGASVLVLRGKETILDFTAPSSRSRLVEIPQSTMTSLHRMSQDGRHLWGYSFTGHLYRIDLQDFSIQMMDGWSEQVLDILPWQDGLLLSTWADGIGFVDQKMNWKGGRIPIAAAPPTTIVCRSVAPVGELEESDLGVHPATWAAWDMSGLPPTAIPGAVQHFYEQRAQLADPFLLVRTKQVGVVWRIAYLEPPAFDHLVILELPTGRKTSLSWPQASRYAQAFGFDKVGNAIVFDGIDGFNRWDFSLD